MTDNSARLSQAVRLDARAAYLLAFVSRGVVHRAACQPSARLLRHCADDAQVVQKMLQGRSVGAHLARPLGARPQHHQRVAHAQRARLRIARHVRRVQLRDLPARGAQRGDRGGELDAVALVGPGQRHQILHRRVRADGPRAHVALDRRRQLAHQRDAPAHPAGGTIETARQLIAAEPEALVHLAQEPSLLDRAIGVARPQDALEHQRVRLPKLPRRRAHRVVRQPPKNAHPLVAVDHDVPLSVAHDHDRRLLASLRDRREQPTLPTRAPRA